MKNPYSKVTPESVIMEKTTKKRIYNPKTLTMEPFPGDKNPGIEQAIQFYKVEYDDKSDREYKSVIHVKHQKSKPATKQNLKRLTFPVIK